EYGLLGVTPVTASAATMRKYGLYDRQPTAVEIRGVPEVSPAWNIIKRDDILLRINDQTLYASGDLMRVVGQLPPETDVKVELFRPHRDRPERGQMLTVHSKLGKWPVRDDEGIVASRPKYPAWRGLRVDYPSARQKFINQEPNFLK